MHQIVKPTPEATDGGWALYLNSTMLAATLHNS
jgi:hypothetical protein